MNNLVGKVFTISGMVIEVVAEEDDRWVARNTTTNETVYFKKSVLNNAIKLGKAEELTESDDSEK